MEESKETEGVLPAEPELIPPSASLALRQQMILRGVILSEEAVQSAKLAWETLLKGAEEGTVTTTQVNCAREILDRLIGKPDTRRVIKLENDVILRACLRAVTRVYGKEKRDEFLRTLSDELGLNPEDWG